jgi:hypothetical protein
LCVRAGQLQAAASAAVAIVRDLGTMSIGFYIFLHEEAHRPSDWGLLLTGVALVGGPAALQFALLLRAARGTDSPSSPPAADSQAQRSPAQS